MDKYYAKIIFVLLFFSGNLVLGQQYIYETNTFKKGIYRTFQEFLNNTPSLDLPASSSNGKGYGFFNGSGSVQYGQIEVTKEERKALGKVYGFCDGQSIYILPESPEGETLRKKTQFNKILYVGRYCYYEEVISSYNAQTGGSTSTVGRRVINLENGEVTTLTKNTIRDILADNETLLRKFDQETKKDHVIKDYILEYCEEEKRIFQQLDEEIENF